MASRESVEAGETPKIRHVPIKKLERALEQLSEKVSEQKRQLKSTFQQLHKMLTQREEELEAEIDGLIDGIATKIAERRENLEQLSELKEETEKVHANRLNGFLQKQMSGIKIEMDAILSERIIFPNLSVSCDLAAIQTTLKEKCQILELDNPYATRTLPDWHGVAKGEGSAELYVPTSISIDPINQSIYVGDGSYHRIQVFSSEGEHLSTLHNQQLSQLYAMKVHGDHIYVSTGYYLYKMNKRGDIVKRLYTDTTILGVCIEGTKLYTCVESSLIVQVYDLNLKPSKKIILAASSFDNATPRDIIANKQHLFVLFAYNSLIDNYHPDPIQVFQPDGTLIRSLVTGKCIKNARYFCLDSCANILVSDYHGHSIRIFSPEGFMIQKVGSEGKTEPGELLNPRGIAVDSKSRIVVVDSKVNNRLQAF